MRLKVSISAEEVVGFDGWFYSLIVLVCIMLFSSIFVDKDGWIPLRTDVSQYPLQSARHLWYYCCLSL